MKRWLRIVPEKGIQFHICWFWLLDGLDLCRGKAGLLQPSTDLNIKLIDCLIDGFPQCDLVYEEVDN